MLKSHGRYDYTPITRLNEARWPNGARLAVYVALGVEEYVFGEGMTENILPGVPQPDLANTSWRDYGNRVGGFRILEACRLLGIPLAILLNTEVYDHAPELMQTLSAAGSEMVGHGLTNSDTLHGRSEADEAAYLTQVREEIRRREGGASGRLVQPLAAAYRPHHRSPRRSRLRLCARLRPGRPAGMAEDPEQAASPHPLCARTERQLDRGRALRDGRGLRANDH